MKKLTNRVEIATTINGKKIPVVHIDLAQANEYGLASEPVCIATNRGYFLKATIEAYSDETKFTFTQGSICLHDSFSYYDMMELLDYANAPVIHTDQDVCLVITNSKTKEVYEPIILHTSKHLDTFCLTPLTFIDKDYDTKGYLELAGIKQELRN